MRRIVWVLIAAVLLSGCSSSTPSIIPPEDEPSFAQTEPAPEPTFPILSSATPSPSPELSPSEPPESSPEPSQPPDPPPEDLEDEELVRVLDYIPDIVIDLKYASDDNFMGKVIYDFDEAYLRFGTVKKLRTVQEELREQSLGLKIWDAFRPVAAQFVLWETVPDARYVANPNTGYSNHSRGNTVDITLVDADGNEQEMPTDFDEFTALASRNYSNVPKPAAQNALLLQTLY